MTFVLYQSELKKFVDKKEERNIGLILKENMDNMHYRSPTPIYFL